MRGALRTAALAAVLAAGAAGTAALAGSEGPEIEPGSDVFNRFLFFAVLEGACEDGIPKDAVKAILERDEKGRYRNFVYACPVCGPVVDALRAYGMRWDFYYAWKSDPLVDERSPSPVADLTGRILGTDPVARGGVLRDLVERWVDRRMDRLRLDDAERAAWREAMVVGRKIGMSNLASPGVSEGFQFKSCPSCDGAAGKEFDWK